MKLISPYLKPKFKQPGLLSTVCPETKQRRGLLILKVWQPLKLEGSLAFPFTWKGGVWATGLHSELSLTTSPSIGPQRQVCTSKPTYSLVGVPPPVPTPAAPGGPDRPAFYSPQDSHLISEGLKLLWCGVNNLQDLYCNVSCKLVCSQYNQLNDLSLLFMDPSSEIQWIIY